MNLTTKIVSTCLTMLVLSACDTAPTTSSESGKHKLSFDAQAEDPHPATKAPNVYSSTHETKTNAPATKAAASQSPNNATAPVVPANKTAVASQVTPEFLAKKGFQSITFSASGNSYLVYFKRDRLARADKIVTYVSKGTQFTGTSADDSKVQNMLRDAYRARGLCKQGLHPGLINLGYGPGTDGDIVYWTAYVRCSEKKQANI